jgi:hypothetical protein
MPKPSNHKERVSVTSVTHLRCVSRSVTRHATPNVTQRDIVTLCHALSRSFVAGELHQLPLAPLPFLAFFVIHNPINNGRRRGCQLLVGFVVSSGHLLRFGGNAVRRFGAESAWRYASLRA